MYLGVSFFAYSYADMQRQADHMEDWGREINIYNMICKIMTEMTYFKFKI